MVGTLYEVGTIIVPVLQMRKRKVREVHKLAQGHITSKRVLLTLEMSFALGPC